MLSGLVAKGPERTKGKSSGQVRQHRAGTVPDHQAVPTDAPKDAADRLDPSSKPFARDISRIAVDPTDARGGPGPASAIATVPSVAQEALRAPGASLEPATRSRFETSFGFDLSRVRIHADPLAAVAARSIQARAFTVGPDIVFSAGRYAPQTGEGQRLLAHELTHVVQQTMLPGGGASMAEAEAEAAHTGTSFLAGRRPSVHRGVAPGAIQREPDGAAQAVDPSLEPALRAAAKARATPDDPTELTIAGAQIVYRIVQAFLPTYSDHISGVGYQASVQGVQAQKSGGSFNISVGKDFILGMKDPTRAALDIKVALGKAEGTQATPQTGHGLLGQMMQQQAPSTATQAATPQAPAQATATPEEQKAEVIATAQRGKAKTVSQGGKTLLTGGITVNAAAQADIKAGLLLNPTDTAHLGFVGNQLGADTAYTTPLDPFRWQTLMTIIRDGSVDIQGIGRGDTFKVKQRDTRGTETDIDPTLRGISANGVSVVRKTLADIAGPPRQRGARDFVSLTATDQVFYAKGDPAIGHELFGHIWLAMHGVASGHGESLRGTTTVKDPLGEVFTGEVDVYIREFVLEAGKKTSRSEDVTDTTLESALQAFTQVAAAPGFTITQFSTSASKAFITAWPKLRRFYAMLLANPVNEAKRLQHITDEIGKARAAQPKDQQEAFDGFMKQRGNVLGAANPEGHLVRTLHL